MIVCKDCGYQNEDDDQFCGGCPGYLPHVGEHIPDAVEEFVEEPATGGDAGLLQRVRQITKRDAADEVVTDAVPETDADDAAAHALAVAQAEEESRRAEEALAAQRAAEEQARRELEERIRAEEESRRAAEESRRRAEEEAEAHRRAEAEAEAARQAEEERERRAAQEAEEARRAAEEQARREAEEQARREAEEAEAQRLQEAREAAEARAVAAAEEERQQAEAAAKAAAEAEEAARAEAERRRAEAEAKAAAEAEERAKAEAEEQKRRAAEEEARRVAAAKAAEEEAARRAAEEARREAEEEARRLEVERRAAEERARKETAAREQAEREAAERARRAAALVAQPPPPPVAPVAPVAKPPARRRGRAPADSPAQGQPPADGGVAPVQPVPEVAARKPTAASPAERAARAPRQKQPPTRRIEPGDLVCGQCGEPNKSDRKFCRRCAASLEEAVVAKTPWRKRIFRRKPKTVEAGERPGRGAGGPGKARKAKRKVTKVWRTVLRWAQALIILAALLAGIGLMGPWGGPSREWAGERWNSVKRMVIPEYEFVNPVEANATATAPDSDANRAIDGFDNTYWSASGSEGVALIVDFGEPTDIDQLGFISGAAGEDYLTQPRPRRLHVVFSDRSTESIELADTDDFQTFDVSARDVTRAEIQVESVYPSQEGDNVSITLIRFFARVR